MTRLPTDKIVRETGASGVDPDTVQFTYTGHVDDETGEVVIDAMEPATPIGGTYTLTDAATGRAEVYDHLGNKLGPPFPLGSPELREHVAYMVQQCEFARGLDPIQRATWRGDHAEAARLMLAEIDGHGADRPAT